MANGYLLPRADFTRNALIDLRGLNAGIDNWQARSQLNVENARQNKLMQMREQQMAQAAARSQAAAGRADRSLTLQEEAAKRDAELFKLKKQGLENDVGRMSPEQRAQLAQQYGVQPGTQGYQSFVLRGQLPSQQGNLYGRSGQVIQDRNGNFYSVQFGGDGSRKVEPLQTGGVPLQPSKGTEVVGDTMRDKATGRVIENVAPNIAGAERAKVVGREEGKTQAQYPKARASFDMANQKWSRIQPSIQRAEQLIRNNPNVVGLLGSAASRVPGTAAYRLGQYLETIRANIGFAELQAMRDASPTGGALGQVSEFENRLLQAVQGSLQQGLDAPTLLQNLREVRTNLNLVRRYTQDAFRRTYPNGAPAQTRAQQPTIREAIKDRYKKYGVELE